MNTETLQVGRACKLGHNCSNCKHELQVTVVSYKLDKLQGIEHNIVSYGDQDQIFSHRVKNKKMSLIIH